MSWPCSSLSRTEGRQAVGCTSDGGGHVALLFWPPMQRAGWPTGVRMAREEGVGETTRKTPFARLVATLDYPLYIVTTAVGQEDRKSTRLNSSHVKISYAVFCLKK